MLTKSQHIWTTYPPLVFNVVCEWTLTGCLKFLKVFLNIICKMHIAPLHRVRLNFSNWKIHFFGKMPGQGIFKHNKNNMKRKSVKSLKSRCFETLGPFVTKCIRRTVSNANSAEWYGQLHGNLDINADYIINKQVELLKNYLWSHIIWYDYNEMFKTLLQSIENALHITRKTWNPKSNMSQYRRVSTNWIPIRMTNEGLYTIVTHSHPISYHLTRGLK